MDVVWSTGARVKRYSWEIGPFHEELSMKRDHVDLSRMNKGAPLLNNHGSFFGGLRDILGVVVEGSAKIVKGEGRATVRFSKRKEIADLVEDIREGVIRNLSVGYQTHKAEELDEPADDGAPIMRATAWEPMEISFVTIPADMNAQSRSQQTTGESHELIIERKENSTMGKKKSKATVAKRSPGNPVHEEATNPKVKKTGAVVTDDDSDEDELDEGIESVDEDDSELSASGADEDDGDVDGDDDADDSDDEEGEEGDDDDSDGDDEEGDEGDDDADDSDDDDEEGDEEKPAKKTKKKAAKKAAKKTPAKKKTGKRAAMKPDEIRAQEVLRGNLIRKQVRLAGLGEEFADTLVAEVNLTTQGAATRIFAEMEKRSSKPTMNKRIEVNEMKTAQARRAACVRGIMHRQDPVTNKLKNDGDQEFRQGSILGTARHFLAAEGVRGAYSMSDADVARRSLHTSSDFANVLADVSNASVRDGYDSVPATYEPFAATRNAKNFKDIRSVEISNGGRLEPVNEHGEYRRTSLVEGAQAYRVQKYGIVIGKTFELIVNDDLNALTDIPAKLGRRARELENITFWNLILSNPVMSDGNQFFSAAHGNVGTGGVLSTTTLGEARAKQRVQKDLDGELIAGLSPEYIVTPASIETSVEAFLTPIQPVQTSNVNPFQGKLQQIVEPLLDANSLTAYYLFASKRKRAIAEFAKLDGKGPEIFTREGFNVDGFETKIRYIFGMGLIDWRAAFKNAGV